MTSRSDCFFSRVYATGALCLNFDSLGWHIFARKNTSSLPVNGLVVSLTCNRSNGSEEHNANLSGGLSHYRTCKLFHDMR